MAIQYTCKSDGDILLIKASGVSQDLEEAKRFSAAIAQTARVSGNLHVLCDESEVIYQIGLVDTYEAASYFAEQAPHLAKVAVVRPFEGFQDAKFWETVAVNRGLIARVFSDADQARQWLNNGNGFGEPN